MATILKYHSLLNIFESLSAALMNTKANGNKANVDSHIPRAGLNLLVVAKLLLF